MREHGSTATHQCDQVTHILLLTPDLARRQIIVQRHMYKMIAHFASESASDETLMESTALLPCSKKFLEKYGNREEIYKTQAGI